MKGAHVCGLHMPGHPLDGCTFGVVGAITPLVDIWLDEGRLPNYMRAVPKDWRNQPVALLRARGCSVGHCAWMGFASTHCMVDA